MQVRVNPERLLWILIACIAFLGTMHLVTRYIVFQEVEGETLHALLALFNMNHEISIPTWFSQVLLLTAAGVALVNGAVRRAQGKRYAIHWTIIAAILLFMSLDEGSQVHEIATKPLQNALNAHGSLLHYTWILAASALIVVVVAIFVRFWWRLPAQTRVLTFAAAAVFITGAIGFEVLGGYVARSVSTGMKLVGVNMLEETFEMLGATLAIYAFLVFLRRISPRNSILITGGRAQSDTRDVDPVSDASAARPSEPKAVGSAPKTRKT